MTAKVLDAANAAPLASDAERSGFWHMALVGAALVAGVLALGLCLGFGILHYGRQHLAHQAKVSDIQNPPSGSPEIGSSPKNTGLGYGKSHVPKIKPQVATNKIATKAINTPAMPSFSPEKAPKQPEPLTPAEQDFAKQLAIFERKL